MNTVFEDIDFKNLCTTILNEKSRHVIICMSRRFGKTTLIAKRAIRLTGDIVIAVPNNNQKDYMYETILKKLEMYNIFPISRYKIEGRIRTNYNNIRIVSNKLDTCGLRADHLMLDNAELMDKDLKMNFYACTFGNKDSTIMEFMTELPNNFRHDFKNCKFYNLFNRTIEVL